MALFKILKGSSTNLKEQKATEGYAYFTPDDGKFYIDTASTTSKDSVVTSFNSSTTSDGKTPNRICINPDIDIIDCGDSTVTQ